MKPGAEENGRARRRAFALLVAGAVLVLDQASKEWILTRFMMPPQTVEVSAFFNVVLVWNRGVSFGFFNNDSPYNSYVLAALSGSVAMGLLLWLWHVPVLRIRLAMGAIVGGAVGNILDRLRYDGVIDFLDFHLGGMHWPAFNIADSAITIGAMVVVADALFHRSDSHRI
ncbi:MAG: signal peptidase II [Rhodospirillaceae bacterium]|nr:MAG: signal peptidase II [Rhodospirillaceae bacterium]